MAESSIGVDGTSDQGGSCYLKERMDPAVHKSTYKIGVLSIRGKKSAAREFNATFSTYLTLAAGPHFDPPISFEMVPLNFLQFFEAVEENTVDFVYLNPSAFSCVESEYKAHSLVSQISRVKAQNKIHHLNQFGGVIMARADNDAISTIRDLKGKVIAAASISGLGSGQMQFKQMILAGMSYINDPAQLVFTQNQRVIVNGVLSGDFDVGFVRTDQIGRTKDDSGELVDTSLLKVIDPIANLTFNSGRGHQPFPFQSSTSLYPEWNLASLPNVPMDVSSQVQEAMLHIAQHASAAQSLEDCEVAYGSQHCASLQFPRDFNLTARCDTTRELALLASDAMAKGRYSGWTPTLSYMQLRAMQEATGFIQFESSSETWRCVRSTELYDAISCPNGQQKKSPSDVAGACAEMGLTCPSDFQCLCRPCHEPSSGCVNSVDMMGRCVSYGVLLPCILVPAAVLSVAFFAWIYHRKSVQMNQQAQHSAKKERDLNFLAQKERDLNEFIAHEVRNPLAAALSACTFVGYALKDREALQNPHDFQVVKEDVSVIDCSLKFISDLMRSILDSHRFYQNKMVLQEKVVAIRCDLLESVSSILYTRDRNFSVDLDCGSDLGVEGDRLRLNQVLLNLARNASKFVTEGFVRLRANVVSNEVHLYVEDSGPGIPESKRGKLFTKFQESLDSLAQGTGLGLNLCQKLVEAMGGDIYHDTNYVSGFKDYPGTRIVINLRKPPLALEDDNTQQEHQTEEMLPSDEKSLSSFQVVGVPQETIRVAGSKPALPKNLSILFVDDDRILRKQGVRAIQRVLPDATFREAASGESALRVCLEESAEFDVIFLDQYMTSHEQTMLGTETARALRAGGVSSIICGLSANNLEELFINAGCNSFLLKPFPCRDDELVPFLEKLLKPAKGPLKGENPSNGNSSNNSYIAPESKETTNSEEEDFV